MATLNGTAGNDTIIGTPDADTINGLGGDDFLAGDSGDDSIAGGTGNDTIYGDGGNDWIEGGPGNDSLSGGAGQDSYAFREFGAANADSVANFATGWDNIQLDVAAFTNIGATGRLAPGDARFYAAPGAMEGHAPADRIIYNTSTGQLFYDADGNGPGTAQLIATLQGAPGITATDINAFGTAPSGMVINGTDGNDSLVGGPGDDTIYGYGGNDTLVGLGGNDSLVGGPGADSMLGGDGNDTLDGWNRPTNGPSTGYNDVDVDTMDGGLGNDTYYVDNPNDVLIDAGGIDTVITRNTPWTLGPGFENLTVMVDDQGGLGIGNELDNIIDGSHAYNSRLYGMGGNDLIIGGAGKSSLYGGDGNDTLIGGDLDFLDGGNGDDVLSGGARTTMTGGPGADNFLFNSPQNLVSGGSDNTITDFISGVDRITLDAHIMTPTLQRPTSGSSTGLHPRRPPRRPPHRRRRRRRAASLAPRATMT